MEKREKMPAKTLALIGAGPKSMAILAKAAALKACKHGVPDLVVVEQSRVGAHWAGQHGYTDGKHVLGTAPEKDVGFPYRGLFESAVDQYMMATFSFHAFRLEQLQGKLERYGERTDRGGKEVTRHSEWAAYLSWVKDKANAKMVTGEVVSLREDGKSWFMKCKLASGGQTEIKADGVVLTGPGTAKRFPGQPLSHPRIADGFDFWDRLEEFNDLDWDGEPIGVIGSGETAASVVLTLARILTTPVPILVLNQQGAIFSRGEGFFENQLYTEPELWPELDLAQRSEVIRRTDRGVFSQQAINEINQLENLDHETMHVEKIAIDTTYDPIGYPWLIGEASHGGKSTVPKKRELQRAIVATGFDPWWFVKILEDPKLKASLSRSRDELREGIGRDLTFRPDQMPIPKLHVPMLAGLAQGPGFPNLSCLGHLADRVLDAYVT